MPTDTHSLQETARPVLWRVLNFLPDRATLSRGSRASAQQPAPTHASTDITWNPKQMVGKTLKTEVQEEAL